jgi:hypothetical protein
MEEWEKRIFLSYNHDYLNRTASKINITEKSNKKPEKKEINDKLITGNLNLQKG